MLTLFSAPEKKRKKNLWFQAPKPMVLEGKTTCFEGHNPTIWVSTTYGLTAAWVQNQQK